MSRYITLLRMINSLSFLALSAGHESASHDRKAICLGLLKRQLPQTTHLLFYKAFRIFRQRERVEHLADIQSQRFLQQRLQWAVGTSHTKINKQPVCWFPKTQMNDSRGKSIVHKSFWGIPLWKSTSNIPQKRPDILSSRLCGHLRSLKFSNNHIMIYTFAERGSSREKAWKGESPFSCLVQLVFHVNVIFVGQGKGCSRTGSVFSPAPRAETG